MFDSVNSKMFALRKFPAIRYLLILENIPPPLLFEEPLQFTTH